MPIWLGLDGVWTSVIAAEALGACIAVCFFHDAAAQIPLPVGSISIQQNRGDESPSFYFFMVICAHMSVHTRISNIPSPTISRLATGSANHPIVPPSPQAADPIPAEKNSRLHKKAQAAVGTSRMPVMLAPTPSPMLFTASAAPKSRVLFSVNARGTRSPPSFPFWEKPGAAVG